MSPPQEVAVGVAHHGRLPALYGAQRRFVGYPEKRATDFCLAAGAEWI
jgi:hypothetical protein